MKNCLLALCALTIGNLSTAFAGGRTDATTRKLREDFRNAQVPTLADLQLGKTWTCEMHDAMDESNPPANDSIEPHIMVLKTFNAEPDIYEMTLLNKAGPYNKLNLLLHARSGLCGIFAYSQVACSRGSAGGHGGSVGGPGSYPGNWEVWTNYVDQRATLCYRFDGSGTAPRLVVEAALDVGEEQCEVIRKEGPWGDKSEVPSHSSWTVASFGTCYLSASDEPQ